MRIVISTTSYPAGADDLTAVEALSAPRREEALRDSNVTADARFAAYEEAGYIWVVPT
jgi:hypothetical protein